MKILIIGGTIFLGRHIIESLLEDNHEVYMYNRGKHNSDLFEDKVTYIQGDRENQDDLKKLDNENFDAIIDTCAYFPHTVKKSAEFFKNKCKLYVFISTISVYKDNAIVGLDEDYPHIEVSKETDLTKITNESYGYLKSECEKIVNQIFNEKALIIRPGYIVGAYDQSDRFNMYLTEAYKNRAYLCPGTNTDFIQFIDVKDLSDWIRHLVKNNIAGTFNATGNSYMFIDFAKMNLNIANNNQEIIELSPDFLQNNNLNKYFIMYVENKNDYTGYCKVNIEKALANGLKLRDYQITHKEIINFINTENFDYRLKTCYNDLEYQQIINLVNS